MRGLFNRLIGFMMIAAVFIVAMPVACLAAEAGSPVAEALGGLLLDTILPALVVLVGTLTALLIRKLTVKLGIEANEELERMAATQAEAAVQYAGEMAASRLKQKDIKVTGNEKLNTAVAYLITHVPSLTREQAESLVHAALARIRGEGATGTVVMTPAHGTYMYETHSAPA